MATVPASLPSSDQHRSCQKILLSLWPLTKMEAAHFAVSVRCFLSFLASVCWVIGFVLPDPWGPVHVMMSVPVCTWQAFVPRLS